MNKIMKKNSIKSLVYSLSSLVLIAMVMVSCEKDESKIKMNFNSVTTGNVSNITRTSAVIDGYYNYYGVMGSMLEAGFETFDYQDLVLSKDLLYLDYELFSQVLDTLKKDVILVDFRTDDAEFYQAGVAISERRDFYEGDGTKGTIYSKSKHLKPKVDYFSDKIEGLKPGTKYYYKTYISTSLVGDCTSPQLQNVNGEPWKLSDNLEISEEDFLRVHYVVYGDTKSFTTLP